MSKWQTEAKVHFLATLTKSTPCIAKYASQTPARWQRQDDEFQHGPSASTSQCTAAAKHVCFPNK